MWSNAPVVASPKIWLVSAIGLTAVGVALPEGWGLCLPAALLALAALLRHRRSAPITLASDGLRRLSWGVLVTASLALLTTFTVRVAVPNIVSAGNAASDALAVSTLRTLMWAEDQFIAR